MLLLKLLGVPPVHIVWALDTLPPTAVTVLIFIDAVVYDVQPDELYKQRYQLSLLNELGEYVLLVLVPLAVLKVVLSDEDCH